MNFLSLFSGIGGIDLGLERAGMRCVGQVEIDPFCRTGLARHWPDVPRFCDVRTFEVSSLANPVDLVAASFPCQDISSSGKKDGINGARSGLFFDAMRIVRELGPSFVILENVSGLLDRGLDTVLGTLAEGGYDAEWRELSAFDFGADHLRRRVFIVAYPESSRREVILRGEPGVGVEPHPAWGASDPLDSPIDRAHRIAAWLGQPAIFGRTYGFPARLAERQLGAFGNAVVPGIAEWIGRAILASIPPTKGRP